MKTREFDGVVFELSDAMVASYFDRMTGRIFKVIPIREEHEYPVQPYLESLLRELLGAKDIMESIGNDERFIQVVGIINYLVLNPDIDVKIMKSEIFHALNIVKKISKVFEERMTHPVPKDDGNKSESAEG